MNAPTTFPPEPAGMLQLREARKQLRFRRLVALFERDEVEAAVDALIAHLDMLDGNPDIEPNGDEEDDPGDLKDVAYIEWQTRGRHKLDRYEAEALARDVHGNIVAEDEEDDDEAEDDGEDRCAGGDDHVIAGPVSQPACYQRYPQLAGLMVGDDGDAEPCYVPASMDGPMAANAS